MKERKMGNDTVRVIKIGKEALFEFIYENFIDNQEDFLDVDPLKVCNSFDIDWERGEFIFCASNNQTEDAIDLEMLMKNIPVTTTTMYADGRYREYTKEELIKLSKEPEHD